MKRSFKSVPGYDCRLECKHKVKGDHGVHGDDWIYSITADDGLTAIVLTVFSNRFPATVDVDILRSFPMGADLSLHCAFPTEPDACMSKGTFGEECEFLDGKMCVRSYSSALRADEFWNAHGRPQKEQHESFWTALEEIFRGLDARARTDGMEAAAWIRCSCCDGLGRVRRTKVS